MPRDVVHGIIGVVDPKGLKDRKPNKKNKTKAREVWIFRCNFLDGPDKPMEYHDSTFPLAVYERAVARSCGCMYGQLIVIQFEQHFGMLALWKKCIYSQWHYDLIKALRQQP